MVTEPDVSLFHTLNDVYPNLVINPLTNFTVGILPPSLNFTKNRMGVEYITRSGNKCLSSLFINILNHYGIVYNGEYYTISTQGEKQLIGIITDRFQNKWNSIYNTTIMEFDALNPYTMEIDEEHTNTLTSSTGNSSTRLDNSSRTTEDFNLDDENNGVYGFNSNRSVPSSDRSKSSNTSSNDSISNNTTLEGTTEYERSNPSTAKIIRSGNIGNLTKQDLIDRQRQFLEYQIWDTIFKDLDSVYTRSKYYI